MKFRWSCRGISIKPIECPACSPSAKSRGSWSNVKLLAVMRCATCDAVLPSPMEYFRGCRCSRGDVMLPFVCSDEERVDDRGDEVRCGEFAAPALPRVLRFMWSWSVSWVSSRLSSLSVRRRSVSGCRLSTGCWEEEENVSIGSLPGSGAFVYVCNSISCASRSGDMLELCGY